MLSVGGAGRGKPVRVMLLVRMGRKKVMERLRCEMRMRAVKVGRELEDVSLRRMVLARS